jgi:hypothetical protein
MTIRAIAYDGFPMMHDLNPYDTCKVDKCKIKVYLYLAI